MGSNTILRVGAEVGHLVLRERLADLGDVQQWLVECFCGAFAVWTDERLIWAVTPGSGPSKTLCTVCHVKKKRKRTGFSKKPEYLVWRAAYNRCHNKNHPYYGDYGGRGIRMDPYWHPKNNGFPAFLAHVGNRPSVDYSLDRIDNDGNYEPGNVRWATNREQLNNRRITKTWWIDDIAEAVIDRFGFWSDLFLFAITMTDDQTVESFVKRLTDPPTTFLLRKRYVGSNAHASAHNALKSMGVPFLGTVRAPWNPKRGYNFFSRLPKHEASARFTKLVTERYVPVLTGETA